MENLTNKPGECPVEVAVNMIGGKWKILLLARLRFFGPQRFGELLRAFPGLSERILTRQLRQLESDGLVLRKAYPQIPPRVEYRLSDEGDSLGPILDLLAEWGRRHQTRPTIKPGLSADNSQR
ncbi:MAG TPA: transcriptional regulator [Gammaproteobacteria bacterium]|nr:transcriptional regulator [Gammaproteobacteria bacterium]